MDMYACGVCHGVVLGNVGREEVEAACGLVVVHVRSG
jgi:hypothetical protein